MTAGGRDFRHWKQKFWKRRTNLRAARAHRPQEQPLPEWADRSR